MQRYVIVGSGAAGLAAAETLRRHDPTARVTLITGDRFGYYSRPGLAYLLADEINADQLYPYTPENLRRSGIEWVNAHADRLDPLLHTLHLKDGREFGYDRLLLATGATAILPDLPGIHLDGVVKLDTYEDVQRILHRVQRGKAAVVVGGGITALELVEGLAARGMRVHYLMRGQRYWSSVLDPTESQFVQERLRQDGVVVHTLTQAIEIYGRRNVEGVITQDGERIQCRLAAFAVGIRPRLELARSAALDVQRGIRVNEFLQTSQPDIFAAGDGAELSDPNTSKGILESLWSSARRQGQAAGQNMSGRFKPYQVLPALNVTRLAGQVTTIIGKVGQETFETDRDLNGIMRGDSENFRQVSHAMVAQNRQGSNRLRLFVGEKVLHGALIMGDQSLSRPLQHLIENQVNISSIRPALLAPEADLAHILQTFQKQAV